MNKNKYTPAPENIMYPDEQEYPDFQNDVDGTGQGSILDKLTTEVPSKTEEEKMYDELATKLELLSISSQLATRCIDTLIYAVNRLEKKNNKLRKRIEKLEKKIDGEKKPSKGKTTIHPTPDKSHGVSY